MKPGGLGVVLGCACVLLMGCDGDSDTSSGEGGAGATGGGGAGAYAGGSGQGLDPNVPPLTEGDWARPEVDGTWQWQLNGTVNTDYDVGLYDIDLFEADEALIGPIQEAGQLVICYFSAGSSEDWRPDFDQFASSDMGNQLDEWQGERWLDVRSTNVHGIMLARLDLAVSKGCDGVEPDNVDGFANDTGFNLTATDQLAYNRFFANAAHERNLAVGLKNDGGQVAELVDYYDFELNEQCHEFGECDDLSPFVAAGKPILNCEYTEEDTLEAAEALAETICPAALAADIRTLVMPWDLDDAFRVSCDP